MGGLKCIILYENKAHSYHMQDGKWAFFTSHSDWIQSSPQKWRRSFEMQADFEDLKSLLLCQNEWRMKFWTAIELHRHCLADVDYFPPWSHANNTTHWGIPVTLSRHTVPTWLLVTSVRGTRIFEHVTSFKTAKRCHSTHSKIQQLGDTTADRPGVNCSCTPLLSFFFSHSPVRQRRTSTWGRRADGRGFLAWNV